MLEIDDEKLIDMLAVLACVHETHGVQSWDHECTFIDAFNDDRIDIIYSQVHLVERAELVDQTVDDDQEEKALGNLAKISLWMLKDLQIFNSVAHPSFQVQQWRTQTNPDGTSGKEGFSLFNLFDFTVTYAGRAILRKIFSQPLRDAKVI